MSLTTVWQNVSPDTLAEMGKTAATISESQGMTLTDAVIRAVGNTKLSNQQLHRVVEHANHEAFHRKFASMDPTMRVVNLEGGPADPTAVVARLGGTAEKVASFEDLSAYRTPPTKGITAGATVSETEKVAEAYEAEEQIEILEMLENMKLASEELEARVGSTRYQAQAAFERCVTYAKTACAEGAYLEDFENAWGPVSPQRAVEVLGMVLPESAPAHIKTASRAIDPEHPMMKAFQDYVKLSQEHVVAKIALEDMGREFRRLCGGLR